MTVDNLDPTSVPASTWKPMAERLAADLVSSGDIKHDRWHDAVAAIPRHVFVPRHYEQDRSAGLVLREGFDQQRLELIYSPTSLVTRLMGNPTPIPVSSSTKPDLMVRMLEQLDIQPHHQVCEIGTGTGYNAALLSYVVGDHKVSSVDVAPSVVDEARTALRRIGYRPSLYARDGALGIPEDAPFDRLITTTSTSRVPWAWAAQLRPGGLALFDFKLGISGGNLALLRRTADGMHGHFMSRWAAFMEMRPNDDPIEAIKFQEPAPQAGERLTDAPAQPWNDYTLAWFLAHLELPPNVQFGFILDPETMQPTTSTMRTPDGSWAHVRHEPGADGRRQVRFGGSVDLWGAFEHAYELWCELDQPGWEQFGMTVTPESQILWLDSPDRMSWRLP